LGVQVPHRPPIKYGVTCSKALANLICNQIVVDSISTSSTKNNKTNMIVFKNLNDNKTYIIYKAPNGNCLAIPFKHDGPSIPKCDIKDFVVVTSDEGRLDGFL